MPKFVHKPTVVEAIRLTVDLTITSARVRGEANVDDWLLTDIEGGQYAIPHSVFMALYEPADDDAVQYLDKVTRR